MAKKEFEDGICFNAMLAAAWENGFQYAAFITDYCISARDMIPYLVYIPDLIEKIQNMNNDHYWDLSYTKFNYALNITLGVGVDLMNPKDNIIMFYGGSANPKVSNDFSGFLERWQDVLTYYHELEQETPCTREIYATP